MLHQILSLSLSVRHYGLPSDTVILDIETANMRRKSASIGALYLIWQTDDAFLEERYICEKKEDEYDLLLAMSAALDEKACIITFNGTSFDLPRIRSRLALFGLADPFLNKTHIDLYLTLRPLDRFFHLSDRKLISYASLLPDAAWAKEDAQRTLLVSALLPLADFLNGDYAIKNCTHIPEERCVVFSLAMPKPYPLPLERTDGCFRISIDGDVATLRVTEENGRLRRYYTDVENYVYLPREGYAVHKTVGAIVADSRKEKAVRENCFTWYMPPDDFFTDHSLQRMYTDSVLAYLKH